MKRNITPSREGKGTSNPGTSSSWKMSIIKTTTTRTRRGTTAGAKTEEEIKGGEDWKCEGQDYKGDNANYFDVLQRAIRGGVSRVN